MQPREVISERVSAGLTSHTAVLSYLQAILLGLAGFGLLSTRAAAQAPTEYEVKAAFLYNFAKFVEWPAGRFPTPSSAIEICVLGSDPFGDELSKMTSGKMVSGHALDIKQPRSAEDARNCHILFISKSERSHFRSQLQALQGYSVLTVGDASGFIEQGGMINFVLQDDRVQFEINLRAAKAADLKISSKLLAIAKLINV